MVNSTEVDSSSEENETNAQPPGDDPSTSTFERNQSPAAYLRHNTVNGEFEDNFLRRDGRHTRGFDSDPPLSSIEQDSTEYSSWEAAPSIRFQRQFLW